MPVVKTYTAWFDGHLDHPDTQRLATELESLGLPRRWRTWAGMVAPLLNLYCLQHQEDGDVTHLPAERIAAICHWPIPAKAEEFVSCLKYVGILDEDEQEDGRVRYYVHNFRHYNRRLLSERQRKREARGAYSSADAYADRPPPLSADAGEDGYADGSVERLATGPRRVGDESATGWRNKVKAKAKIKHRERPLSVQTGVESRAGTAGASRPMFEKQENDEQRQDFNGDSTGVVAFSNPQPPVTPTSETNSVTANKTQEIGQPVVSHESRDAETQAYLTMFCSALRPELPELDVRRIVKWLVTERREKILRADTLTWWRMLAIALQCAGRARNGLVRDMVSLFIHMIEKNQEPMDNMFRVAKSVWERQEKIDQDAPAWLGELCAGLFVAPEPVAPVVRSVSEIKAALLETR